MLLAMFRRREQGQDPPHFGDTAFIAAPEAVELRAIYAWWDQLRGAAPFPRRADLSPQALKPFLSHIQLLEVIDGGRDFRVRIYGTHWVDLTGWDFTNCTLSQVINPAIRDKWMSIYIRVVTEKAARCLTTNLNNVGRDFLYVEELLLPFARSGEAVEFLLAAIVQRN
jgi:hypothetical protein